MGTEVLLKNAGPHDPKASFYALPIVSIVVPFWGYLLGSLIMK